jgi:hypothetical protein
MQKIIKTTATAIAVLSMTSQAFAGGTCARPAEALALKTAAVQQQLMVAALYCRDVRPYNNFVIAYRRDLQDSDAQLMSYFLRAGGGRAGEADYHAYKTSLANNYSLEGSRHTDSYCATADAAFQEASNGSESLRDFVSDRRIALRYDACDERTGARDSVAVIGGGE